VRGKYIPGAKEKMVQKLLLMMTTLLLLSNGQAFAAEIGPQSPSGGLGYDCDYGPVLKRCRCSMRDNGSDCKDMLRKEDCMLPIDYPPWDPDYEHDPSLSWDNYLDCDLETGTCSCLITENATTEPVVHDHRSPNIDSNDSTQTEVIAPSNRTGTVRVQRTRPSSSPTNNAPAPIVTDHR
jgi:hypothetical protein